MIRASEVKVGMTIRSDIVTEFTAGRNWSTVRAIVQSPLMIGPDIYFMDLVFEDGRSYTFRTGTLSDEPMWHVRVGDPTVEERLVEIERKVNMIFNTINEHFPIHEPGVVIGGGPVEDRLYKASELKRGMVVRKIGENGDIINKWDRVVRNFGVNIHTWRIIFGESEPYMYTPNELDDDPIWEVQRA